MLLDIDNALIDYFNSVLAFIIIVVFGFLIVGAIIRRYFRNWDEFKSEVARKIVLKNTRPIYWLVVLGGLFIAYLCLPYNTLLYFASDELYIYGGFVAIAILLVCYSTVHLLKIFADHWFVTHQKEPKSPVFLMRIIAPAIFFVGLALILDLYGVDITPVLVAFLIAGCAIGIALQATLSNMFSGMQLATDQPMRSGDYIEVQGTEIAGTVQNIGWASTRILTKENTVVIIPNSKLVAAIIVNHGADQSNTEKQM